jgi:hypothetical protein
MKTNIIVKLLLVLAFGCLFGLITQHTHEKWHRLGRAAYLTHESEWFDTKMAAPTNAAWQAIEWAAIACFIGAAYECTAYIGTSLLTRKPRSQNH